MKKVIMIIAVAAILVGCKGKGTRVQISDSVDKFKVEKLFVVDIPKIYLSVNTPRDEYGFVKGKSKRYFRVGFGKWLTERAFVKKYFSEE